MQEVPGCFVSPTIFDNVTNDMRISQEEIFGPVLCVQSFTTESEALQMSNDNDYGLTATVWTKDSGRGKRMAKSIRAGNISIRTSGAEKALPLVMDREPQKASGFGSESGLRGMQSYCTLKAISFIGD